MKKILTVAICALVFANVSAQTKHKPETSTQPAKPTKAFTINYLNEKLNESCVGTSQEKRRIGIDMMKI